jgi:hypothetical protein
VVKIKLLPLENYHMGITSQSWTRLIYFARASLIAFLTRGKPCYVRYMIVNVINNYVFLWFHNSVLLQSETRRCIFSVANSCRTHRFWGPRCVSSSRRVGALMRTEGSDGRSVSGTVNSLGGGQVWVGRGEGRLSWEEGLTLLVVIKVSKWGLRCLCMY